MHPEFTLTDEDLVAIKVAVDPPMVGEWTWRMECEALYLAGLRAGYRRGIEDAAKECDKIENDTWLRYKRGNKEDRANPDLQGQSGGACDCAAAIRRLAE